MKRYTDSQLLRYLGELSRFGGRRLWFATALMLIAALLDGVGLLFLVPLLSLVGLSGAVAPHLLGEAAHALRTAGLELNLPTMLALYVLLVGAKLALERWRDLVSTALRLDFIDHLRTRFYGHIAQSEWHFFSTTRNADLVHALTTEVGRIGQGTYQLQRVVVTGVLAVAYLAVAVHLSAAFTGAALVSGLLLLVPLRRLQRRTIAVGSRMTGAQRKIFAASDELLSGMKLAKAHAVEARHMALFDRQAARQRRTQLAFQRLQSTARLWYQWGAAAVLALLVWAAVDLLALPTVALLVLIAIFARLAGMLSDLQQGYQQVLHMLPAYAGFRRLEQACIDAAEPPAEAVAPPSLSRELGVHGVVFRYRQGEAALAEVDLAIPACSTVALIGPSGAGKSTLADIIAGLLQPDAGRLTVDGVTLEGPIRRAWRQRIAYVPQETFLLHDSVRANLLWACPDADDACLRETLRQAAAEDFVDRLPDGLDTIVGERGVRLSGGERQRIAIARALLRRPQLLILDEATSALDSDNERAIQEALEALHGSLTVLVIAHRLATVRRADQIVVVQRGRVVETGAWAALAAREGGYLPAMLARQTLA